MGFQYQSPPCGMQTAGGSKNRQLPEYPNGEMIWPDLHEELKVHTRIDRATEERRLEDAEIILTDGEANAIVVDGLAGQGLADTERFLIDHATLKLSGDGRNDFACIGAGVVADNQSDVVIRNSTIETSGLAKCCTSATEGSVLRIYDSELVAHGGVLPEDYDPTPGPGGMLTPPPGLEIGGTARAHLSMKHSMTYFYRSKIVADGWAALSTDASDGFVYLEANDCDIEVKTPGYAVYSDGGCNVVLSNCNVNVATHVGIMAGECSGVFDHIKAKSGKYFLMTHNVMGVTGELAEVSVCGGEIETGEECLYLKSCNSYIELQGTKLQSKSGVLAHAIVNNDMCATKTEGKAVFGNNLIFTDMECEGDFVNDDSDRVMTLTLSGTSLKGGLKDVYLMLDASSRYYASKDSNIALMEYCEDGDELAKGQAITENAFTRLLDQKCIDAAAGVTITVEQHPELKGQEYEAASGGCIRFI